MKAFMSAVLIAAAFAAGWYGQLHLSHSGHDGSESASQSAAKEPLYWVAPMDPNYRRDKPGQSPMGMDLVPVYEEDSDNNDGGVSVSPTMEHNLGVRTAEVIEGPLTLPIKTVGYIAFDEERLIHVHSRVEGWIERLYVTSTGDPVKKGQTLFELYSPQLVNAQEEYLAALRSKNKILQKASRERLVSLGFNNAQINRLQRSKSVNQRVKVYAEQSGVVAKLSVRQGMFIRPSVEIMSVGVLDQVWLIAEVFERQAGWVKEGMATEISVAAAPGKKWQGEVDYIYPVLDEKTRTLQVRLRFANEDRLLKPNMFAEVKLLASVGDQVLSIPREAVIRTGSHNRVVLSEGNGRYRPAFVVLGVESENNIQILDGLTPGQRVVTSAQFLLDSESKIDVALAALEEQRKQDAVPLTVKSEGKIDDVMPEKGMLTVTHEAIEAWKWPVMTMDFQAGKQVDLSSLQAGQDIEFTLEAIENSRYLIKDIKLKASGEGK